MPVQLKQMLPVVAPKMRVFFNQRIALGTNRDLVDVTTRISRLMAKMPSDLFIRYFPVFLQDSDHCKSSLIR